MHCEYFQVLHGASEQLTSPPSVVVVVAYFARAVESACQVGAVHYRSKPTLFSLGGGWCHGPDFLPHCVGQLPDHSQGLLKVVVVGLLLLDPAAFW